MTFSTPSHSLSSASLSPRLEAEVAVVQQALLGGEQRALAVGVEGAALEHERRLVPAHAPGLGDGRRHPRVPVVGREVLAPAVEAEVHHARPVPRRRARRWGRCRGSRSRRAGWGGGRSRGRPRPPRRRQAEQLACLGLLRRVDDHRDRLEPGDAARHLGPLLARVVHERPEEVLAARPREQRALVRREARRQAEPVRARGGRARRRVDSGVVCVMEDLRS